MFPSDESSSEVGPDGRSGAALQRAMRTIRALREQLAASRSQTRVAIVGMALRAPAGIDDPDAYWQAVAAGTDLTGELPEQRRAVFAERWQELPTRGGYLADALGFDADYFGIGPREARSMDPQHRLLLEVVTDAFGDAGLLPGAAAERTGIYVGVTGQDYRDWAAEEPNAYWTMGNGHSFAAGRIAYTLGLRGPTMALDTACSSSLVAVHTAARALVAGDCDVAVAAGVNLVLSPRSTAEIARTGALSPDGRCRPFDARANGFVRGEGCGAVVLKRLADAGADRVLAVIEASGINSDGQSAGFTAPAVGSQIELFDQVLGRGELQPSDIGYLETHGTGTPLGDPIELEAVAGALGRRNGDRPLYLGSVKANLGHAEAAAGVLGLIKAVQVLRHRCIPGQAGFDTLNPRIDLGGTRMAVATGTRPWPADAGRLAAVSSFGMSGTNALVVLGAGPDRAQAAGGQVDSGQVDSGQVDSAQTAGVPVPGFAISARTPAALAELAGRYADLLAGAQPPDYPGFAYTATSGRPRLPEGRWITAPDAATALVALRALAAGDPHSAVGPLLAVPAPDLPRRVVSLPGYPWQHTTYSIRPVAAPPAG